MESIVTNLVLHVVRQLVTNAERIIQFVLNAMMVMEQIMEIALLVLILNV